MFAYRHAALPAGAVVTRARLRATAGAPGLIAGRMADIKAAREASQPVRARTGGSTFRNPDGMKAWELIDAAGCRGLIRGGAMVSEKHCNFLINTGRATAADIEGLGEEVRRRGALDATTTASAVSAWTVGLMSVWSAWKQEFYRRGATSCRRRKLGASRSGVAGACGGCCTGGHFRADRRRCWHDPGCCSLWRHLG